MNIIIVIRNSKVILKLIMNKNSHFQNQKHEPIRSVSAVVNVILLLVILNRALLIVLLVILNIVLIVVLNI